MNRFLFLLMLSAATSGCYVFFWSDSMNELKRAEELSRQGNYTEAIQAYRSHMQKRLALPNRPEWENPYFYQVLIGDIYLGQGDPTDALDSYLEADKQGVDSFLIADRIRSVAQWYEQKGELQSAIDLLTTHRSRDSLLFDSMLDRYARALVKREEIVTH